MYPCVHVHASKSVCESVCVWGGDKHLSPEAAFRFPLTSSVKSAQSLHCHLLATRERPALHTDNLICLVVHAHTQTFTHEYMPVRTCTSTHSLMPTRLSTLSQKFSSNKTTVGDICWICFFFCFVFIAGQRKCFLLDL